MRDADHWHTVYAMPPCLYSLLILSYAVPTSRVFLADLQDTLRLGLDSRLSERSIKITEAVISLVLIISMFGTGLSLAVFAILWVAQSPQGVATD